MRKPRIRSSILACGLAFVSSLGFASPDLGIYHDAFQPSTTRALATFDGQPITEQDVYLWQTMGGGPVLALKDWEKSAGPGGKLQRTQLTAAMRPMIDAYIVASLRPEETTETTRVVVKVPEELGARITCYNIARMIWAETYVAPLVQIAREDLLFHFQESRSRFSVPATATIRRLQVPIEQPITQTGRDRARSRIREIHDEAVRGAGLKPFLDQDPSLHIAPGTPDEELIHPNGGEVESLIESTAFSLSAGALSDPIESTSSLVLVEVLKRTPPHTKTLAEVEPILEEELHFKFLPQQVDYQVGRALLYSHAINRAGLYPFVADDVNMVEIGGFTMTKKDFGAMYAEVAVSLKTAERAFLGTLAQGIIEGEYITRQIENRGLLGDPRYQRGLQLARTALQSAYVRRVMSETSRPSKAELAAYIDEHRQALSPRISRTVWAVRGSITGPVPPPAEAALLAVALEQSMREVLAAAQRQLGDGIGAGGSGSLNPSEVVTRLPKPKDSRLAITVVPLGELNSLTSQEKLGFNVEDLELGSFSPIKAERDGTPASYFVSGDTPLPAPTRKELEERASHAIFVAKTKESSNRRIAEAEKSGRVVWNFETVPLP